MAPTTMIATPIARATTIGLVAMRSMVIAAARMAIAARFIVPTTSRMIMKPEQHNAQCAPNRTPCRQALSGRPGVFPAQTGANRQSASCRAFQGVS